MKKEVIAFLAVVVGTTVGFVAGSHSAKPVEKPWDVYVCPGPGDLQQFKMKVELWKMNNCNKEVTRVEHLRVTVGGQTFTNDLRLGQECPVSLGAAGTFIFHPYDWQREDWQAGSPGGFAYLNKVWIKVTRL